MKRMIVVVVILAISGLVLESRPQYSMLTGNRCLSCHVNVQGGGQRSLLGAYSRSDVSFFDFKDSDLGKFFEYLAESNSFLDDKVQIGFDYRLQSARLGGPESNKREYFSMQASPYININPYSWLSFQAHYNFIETLYPGQQAWSASVTIQPSYSLPQVRIGYFGPSIGNRYDDHTLMVRQVAGPSRANPIIPPDFAELGLEISYDGLKYLNLTAGIFDSGSMSENMVIDAMGQPVPLVEENSISTLLRAAYMPRFFDNAINANIGATYYFNDDFLLINLFAMVGWTDHVSLIFEYMISDKTDIRKTNNYMIEALYQLFPSVMLSARYEAASTDILTNPDNTLVYEADQYVFGLNLYPVPFIEIRPEYRIYDRTNAGSYHSQYTVQLHLYF